ncbi:MAG: hypothetical protein ACKOXQ_05015 [Hydrogenophaga sp.]
MHSQVIVKWNDSSDYRFDLEEVQPLPHEQARAWLDEQFTALQCEPIRLTGKVLTADKVLCVAQAAGELRFREPEHRAWAQAFARAASSALAKPVITVDLPGQSIVY